MFVHGSIIFLCILGVVALALLYIEKSIKKIIKQRHLDNFQLLLSACFGNEIKALKLIKKQLQKDSTLSDDEAAAKALDALLAENAFKDHTQIDYYF